MTIVIRIVNSYRAIAQNFSVRGLKSNQTMSARYRLGILLAKLMFNGCAVRSLLCNQTIKPVLVCDRVLQEAIEL